MDNTENTRRNIERLHRLYKEAMVALEAGKTYDVFVLMNARSQSLLEIMDQQSSLSEEELASLSQETEDFITALQSKIQALQDLSQQFMLTIPARKAYASSQAIGEISSYLVQHQGES